MSRAKVGVLTGLVAEARLLRAAASGEGAFVVACTGADPRRAEDEAGRLVARGATALVSFGLAGGLCPGLSAGDLICAERVLLPDGRAVETDAAWRLRLLGLARPCGKTAGGAVVGIDRLLATATEKRHLAGVSGAIAADMESHAVAASAERAGLPFIVVRAVSDPAGRGLPAVARAPLRPGGRIDVAAVAAALAGRPWEWPAVVRLALDTRAALATLRCVVHADALLPERAWLRT